MKTLVIDRFEGTLAICEDADRNFFGIELSELPLGAKEGDVLRVNDDEGTVQVDTEETKRRRAEGKRLQDKLFRNK